MSLVAVTVENAMKTCTKCRKSLPTSDFHRNRQAKDGVYPSCKTCVNTRHAQHRAANRDRILAARDRERERATTQAWYARNPGYSRRYYQDHKAEHLARRRKWIAEHADVHRAQSSARRARLRADKTTLTEVVEYSNIIIRDPCVYCGNPAQDIDHIVPLARGGTPTWDNLAPTCASCNRSKHARPLLSFMLTRLAP